MTAVEVQVYGVRTPDPVALGHRENCLCNKPAREIPARMDDERRISPSLLTDAVLRLLARKLEDAGAPMVRTYRPRYNPAGEPIGPELHIRCCDALLFDRVLDRVFLTIERGAERQA